MSTPFIFSLPVRRVPVIRRPRVFKTKPVFKRADGLECASALGESKDCTVRALQHTHRLDYNTAHAMLAWLGRKPRHGFHLALNCKRFGVRSRPDLREKTILTTLRNLPRGNFWVKTKGHIFAVIDGVIRDYCPESPLTHVRGVYQCPQFDPARQLPAPASV